MQERIEQEYTAEELSELVWSRLSDMRAGDLRSLADEHGIDISGLKEKADLVDAIALHPGIARILGLDQGIEEETLPPPEEEFTDEPEEPVDEEIWQEAGTEDLRERVDQALKASVDFSHLEQLLSEAATKFNDRSYDVTIETARDSVLKIEEKVKDYVEASWAFAIASTQRILEASKRSSKPGKEANARLKESIDVFRQGTFTRSPELLEQLTSSALKLYSHEMERARDHITSQERVLEETRAMGGDITAASTIMAKASEALDENRWATYLDVIGEVDSLVTKAREARIEELKESMEGVVSAIEEARSIGGDVQEASNLLEDVRQAISGDDFITANDLMDKAERVALEAQKSQMDKVTQMRDNQIERVKQLIAQIKPAIDKARTEGFDGKEALSDLKAATEFVNSGDYVGALLKAKSAYGSVKAFHSQVAAKKLEKTPVKPADQPEPEPKRAEEIPPPESEEVPETEEAEESVAEEGQPAPQAQICVYCGSENVQVNKRGKARCLDCKKRFRI